MPFTLRQIQYFIAVAENGSVSAAAHQLSVSQSTVTEAIKGLEQDLGTRIVARHARGVELTHKGHQLLRHAHKILADVADAKQSVSEETEPLVGSLHIGVTALVAGYFFADLLARYRRAYPAVTLRIVEDSRDYLEHLLVNGEIDVAVIVVSNLRDQRALRADVLETSPFRLWLPLGHPLTEEESVSLADLVDERQILLSVDEVDETAEVYWRDYGLKPNIAFRTRSVEAVRSLVATGAGVAILPDLAYRPWSLEGDRIEARAIAEALPTVTVGVAWRRGSGLPRAADNFIALAATHRRGRAH